MPRVSEMRPAAEPTSALQRERRDRILRAAAELGNASSLEEVQMADVAGKAEVALGTLYRYFPSKTHLYVGVMVTEVDALADAMPPDTDSDEPAHERVANVMWRATRWLMKKPMLASAMLQSASAAKPSAVADLAKIDDRFGALLLGVLHLDAPTQTQLDLLRIVQLMWLGLLQSGLTTRMSMVEVERDLRLGCSVILASLSD